MKTHLTQAEKDYLEIMGEDIKKLGFGLMRLPKLYEGKEDIDFEEAEKLVKLGDRAVFDSDFEKFGEDCVMGKALDDRAGCALLMELLKEEAEYDITVCFTTREEVGGNSAGNAAFTVDPDIAVVLADSDPILHFVPNRCKFLKTFHSCFPFV